MSYLADRGVKVSKIASVLFVICVLIFSIVLPVSADTIHYISTEDELFSIETDPDATYVLTSDIYINSAHDMLFKNKTNSFTGVLDGNGYTVCNLILNSENENLAFLCYLGSGGVIKNLNFKDCVITSQNNNAFVGGIAVFNLNGRIENCTFIGKLQAGDKVLNKPHYICAINYGELNESNYYLEDTADSSSDIATSSFYSEQVVSSDSFLHTESVNTSSKPQYSSFVSSSQKDKASSKTKESSSSKENTAMEYGDTASYSVSTEDGGKAGPIIFWLAFTVLLSLVAYMVYTEINYQIKLKKDKK